MNVDSLGYVNLYPECPLVESFTELNQNDYNLAGSYIAEYDPNTCAFSIFTEDPNLEDQTIPMQITISPMFNPLGADQCLFDIYISTSCGAVDPEAVFFPDNFFNVYLWAPVSVEFDPLYADPNCAVTDFVIVPLQ